MKKKKTLRPRLKKNHYKVIGHNQDKMIVVKCLKHPITGRIECFDNQNPSLQSFPNLMAMRSHYLAECKKGWCWYTLKSTKGKK